MMSTILLPKQRGVVSVNPNPDREEEAYTLRLSTRITRWHTVLPGTHTHVVHLAHQLPRCPDEAHQEGKQT